MKKFLLACFAFIFFRLAAQTPFGNEWIDYSLTYYKFQITADGVYRIPYSTLASVIPGLSGVSGSSFVLYRNGQQVPLHVSSTGNFGSNDYIEFYGEKNTGFADSVLYASAALQANPYYSLFSDAATYYLAIKASPANLRYLNTPNQLTALPPKETYYMERLLQVYNNSYFEGKYYSSGGTEIYKSLYEEAEGYSNAQYFGSVSGSGQTTQQNYIFNLSNVVPVTGAILRSSFINRSAFEEHQVRIALNGNTIYTQTPSSTGFKYHNPTITIPASLLNNGNDTIRFTELLGGNSLRQNTVCYNELMYPRDFNFNGQNIFRFRLAADANNKKYIEITNFNDNGLQPVLYDLTNRLRLQSTQPPGSATLQFALPPSAADRELILVSGGGNSFTTITSVTPYIFENLQTLSKQGDYIIITHSKLTQSLNGTNWVEEYRQYRDVTASPSTGKYQARIINIDTLYDQFAYGIPKSPLAVRNFIRWAKANWSIKPAYVFLIGKGREAKATRNNNAAAFSQCLIPTFGAPGSDNLLAATRESDTALVAIGRLAAETPQQVKDYYDKIVAYETAQNTYVPNQPIAPKIWQKQVLHFSGGTGANEQVIFRSYLNNYANRAKDTLWGANITAYSKTTNDPISQSLSQIIREQINEGASLLTFFGHSATGAFDFSIDEPENYTNTGKYPVVISNGCFAGFIHDAQPGFSERFVFAPNKAAIAFVATTSLSVSSSLNRFSSAWYNRFCGPEYVARLGQGFAAAYNQILSNTLSSDFDRMVAYEMTLHGDPGIFFNQYPKPDYAIEASSLFFTPNTVTPGLDSFDVNLVVTNLGRAINDSISVTLKRTIFDASNNPLPFTYQKIIRGPYYRDTIRFRMPTQISGTGYGQNLFEPYVDASFAIDEMAELNNGLLAPISIIIQGDDIIPIHPYEFAIVPNQGVTLKASTVNPFAPPRNYRFEIDTSEKFIAPLQTATVFQNIGGVVRWTPTITYKDSTVYYWRVAVDSTTPAWRYSSFIYLNNEFPGWNQSHYYQWQKDVFQNISLDSLTRVFKFPPTVNSIRVNTGIADAVGGNIPFANLGWDYNNFAMHRFRMGSCGFLNGVTFGVIDSATGLAWGSKNNTFPVDNWGDRFGNYHCSNIATTEQFGFDFGTIGNHPTITTPTPATSIVSNQPWGVAIQNFLDSVPAGNYILMYSTNAINYSQWDNDVINALSSIGFPALFFKNGTFNGPFIFFAQKGSAPLLFTTQNGYTTPLDTIFELNTTWFQGQFTSPAIGPAFEWGSMHWKWKSLEQPVTDSMVVDVIGITSTGFDTVLLTTTQENNLFDTNVVKASVYPYLKLRLRALDNTWRTPGQPFYWRILYKKPPEAAINPAAHFVFSDSLSIGGGLSFEIGLENVTNVDMDSMLTKYILRDAQFTNYTSYIRHSPLPGLDTLVLKYNTTLGSNSFLGLNKLILEANPDKDQLEQYHFNNFAEINFSVLGDKINPLMDVTFDGQRIMNGDIVSAKPNILVTLKDENKFLALNDTSLLDIYMKYPGETTPRRMPFDGTVMKFYPADSTNLANGNKALVELNPTFVLDGKYELMVNNRDRSGNHSSSTDNRFEGNTFYDYKIGFEVITKPMITNFLNYPNPFTTSTRFVFTITGSQVPDYIKIQIMNIKGTIVKEIFKEELGPLRIGKNITQYAWDGRDTYGDLLANGIYFYRVVTKMEGEKMEHYAQGFDKYFKKGFGKMAIVR